MAERFQLLTIKMDLHNVLYVSYLVPVDRVRPVVPSELTLAASKGRVFLSIVAMQCRNVHLSRLEWPGFNYDQLNLRTYVLDPKTGNPSVYFVKSGVSSTFIPFATRILGIPWERITFDLLKERSEEGEDFYKAIGNWNGDIEIWMKPSDMKGLDRTVIESITGPRVGFIGRGGSVKRIAIEHKVLDVRRLSLLRIRFPLPVEAGLLSASELENPDSVLIVPESQFSVYIQGRR
ncbi:Uncharacterized conserved protein (COG2071) [Syntrophus gentianae]|uniref:Uncharacterized conserved protein (COG2071) n=1 Tax=Syntrophus gentianae TaxID=43775 RepID=A0A1H7YFJ5_9BACT|nr:DUF2071 domain-containing protein [Syntrophus gentianae]SEM44671.1 Uncharacterized conserved protein (COG2071) [Syntrophus gentianae]